MTTTGGNGAPATPAALLAAPGYAARRLYQAYIAAWTRLVDSTLTGPQFAVLTAVDAYPGVDQGSLASSVSLDRSTMADVVRRLEDRALIERQASISDGRRKLLYLTDGGRKQLAEVNRRARQLDEQLLRGYSERERARLLDEFGKLATRWEALVDEA